MYQPAVNIQGHNAKFVPTKDYKQQKTELFSLVLEKPEVVEFELMMINAVRHNAFGCSLVFNPNPMQYLSVTEAELEYLLSRIRNVPQFMQHIVEVANKIRHATESHHFAVLMQFIPQGSHKNFVSLLHFLLCNSPPLTPLKMTQGCHCFPTNDVRVFQFTYSEAEEQQFAREGYNSLYYHGTWEHNVYSILRNGIKPSANQHVYMADIGTAFGYARSGNKTFLCFAAKDPVINTNIYTYNNTYKYSNSNQIYCFPPQSIVPRAVIWIAGHCSHNAGKVADQVIASLNAAVRK